MANIGGPPGQQPLPHPPGVRPTPINPDPVDFGSNVIVFDPSTPQINQQINTILLAQKANQFGTARTAFFFKPGVYNDITVEIGYYTTVHGLGAHPDDVMLNGGGVMSKGVGDHGLALNNFWRGVENLAITPLNNNQPTTPKNLNINLWAVSQATFMRRVHIRGVLFLYDFNFDWIGGNYSSGGFIADSVVDTSVITGTQQQFLTRNTNVGEWAGGVWNMVFVGDNQNPSEGLWGFPLPDKKPFTVVDKTPVIREKPYLTIGSSGNYFVQVPPLTRESKGPSWLDGSAASLTTAIPINQFYIAKPAADNADNSTLLNSKLQEGFHLILTPGVYHLTAALQVNYPNTVILGLGMSTLIPDRGTPAMQIADVDGCSVSGVVFDAGPENSPSLLIVGPQGSNNDHSSNPTALFDVCCRVGGSTPIARAETCLVVNSNNVLMDNIWLWRADHAEQAAWVGWDVNPCDTGIAVNGAGVSAYGLFVEHFKKSQTLWAGERGATYFYQSEIPYDVPSQSAWVTPSGDNGFPSYVVSPTVSAHKALGLGVYSNFLVPGIQLENAITTPTGPGIQMYHMVTVWLDGKLPSSINHVINGQGEAVYDRDHMTAFV